MGAAGTGRASPDTIAVSATLALRPHVSVGSTPQVGIGSEEVLGALLGYTGSEMRSTDKVISKAHHYRVTPLLANRQFTSARDFVVS